MGAPASCFVALPPADLAAIEGLQGRLPDELRRIHPGDVHLTVSYLGRIDPALHGLFVRKVAKLEFTGARVVLGGLLVLPSRERAAAVTVTLQAGPGKDAVVALMDEQRDRLRALAGLQGEGRPPLPHVTVARPRGKMTDKKRDAVLAWSDAQPALDIEVELGRAVLMRSLPPGGPGPHYEVVG